MAHTLNRADRLQLMKFVCAFAWADLEFNDRERRLVDRFSEDLQLDEQDQAQVRAWMKSPPLPEEVDPTEIPREHREFFVTAVERVILADEDLNDEELETLKLFKQILGA